MNPERPVPPRAFGTGEPQHREALLDAPLRSLPRPSLLDQNLQDLPGIGPSTAKTASKLGIVTLTDLLEHLPAGHRDYERRRTVSELALGEEATVAVSVKSCRVRPTRRRSLRLLECHVADESGSLKAVWFNQDYLADQLTEGTEVLLRGRLEKNRGGPTFRVLEHELPQRSGNGVGRHTTGLVPVYPATEGLSPRRIRDFVWRIRQLERHSLEPLPARLRVAERLPGKADALATAPAKLLDRQANAPFFAPAHVDAAREETRLRHVIVVLDIHGHLLARPENEQCLDGARPARDPAGGVADVLRADDQEVIHSDSVHQTRERGVPATPFRGPAP